MATPNTWDTLGQDIRDDSERLKKIGSQRGGYQTRTGATEETWLDAKDRIQSEFTEALPAMIDEATDLAVSASLASGGPLAFFQSYDADSPSMSDALSGLADGIYEILEDETHGGAATRYTVASHVATFQTTLEATESGSDLTQSATFDAVPQLSGRGAAGANAQAQALANRTNYLLDTFSSATGRTLHEARSRKIAVTVDDAADAEIPLDGFYNLADGSGYVLTADPKGKESPQAQAEWMQVLARSADVYIVMEGDSTGNSSSELYYLNARWKFKKIAALTGSFFSVKYKLWNDDTETFYDTETWQTGTSGFTIWFINLSVPGSTYQLFLGRKYPIAYSDGAGGIIKATSIYNNYGHNHGYAANDGGLHGFNEQCDAFLNLVVNQRVRQPTAQIMLIYQNPYIGGSASTGGADATAFTAATNRAKRWVAERTGCGIIDTWSVLNSLIEQYGNSYVLTNYYEADNNGVHTNAAGSLIRAAALNIATELNLTRIDAGNVRTPPAQQSLFPNGFFNSWASSNPDSVATSATTISKYFGWKDTYAYSLKSVASGAGYLSWNLDTIAHEIRNYDLIVGAYGYAVDGADANWGRWQSVTDTGTRSSQASSGGDGYPRWHLSRIPKIETLTLEIRVLLGVSGDIGYVDRVICGSGGTPFDLAPDGMAPSFSEYYIPENVALTRNAAGEVQFPGTLTVSGTNIDYTSSSTSQSRFAINLEWLEIGETYQASFNSDASTSATIRLKTGTYGSGSDVGSAQTITAGANAFSFTATKLNQSLAVIDASADAIGTDSWAIVKTS